MKGTKNTPWERTGSKLEGISSILQRARRYESLRRKLKKKMCKRHLYLLWYFYQQEKLEERNFTQLLPVLEVTTSATVMLPHL